MDSLGDPCGLLFATRSKRCVDRSMPHLFDVCCGFAVADEDEDRLGRHGRET